MKRMDARPKKREMEEAYGMVFLNGELEVYDSRSCCCYAELYW